jgi:hypothetical protein
MRAAPGSELREQVITIHKAPLGARTHMGVLPPFTLRRIRAPTTGLCTWGALARRARRGNQRPSIL